MAHSCEQLGVLQSDVLVEAPLRPVGLLAGSHRAFVVSADLRGRTPVPLPLLLRLRALLCLLEPQESALQVRLVGPQRPHLRCEHHVGQEQTTVLLVVVAGALLGLGGAALGRELVKESLVEVLHVTVNYIRTRP